MTPGETRLGPGKLEIRNGHVIFSCFLYHYVDGMKVKLLHCCRCCSLLVVIVIMMKF